jgi:mycothiol system anti-sigma-R factor
MDDPFALDPGCQEAVHTLYHFLDGELTEATRIHIQQHLDECGPCLEAFDFEAELRIIIAKKCKERVPDELKARIVAVLLSEGARLPRSS